jgi:lysophospholipase L1-like esterase
MEIIKKLTAKQVMCPNPPVTIAFLGDSVTQGCFECYTKENNQIETVFDYSSAYSTRLREILNILYPNVQVNIINSGISGDSTSGALMRLERDVLRYHPDLVIVSFGLNDVNRPLEEYLSSLEEIFRRCKENGSDVIFMTQCMLNTYVAEGTPTEYIEYAHKTAEYQNSGKVDLYFSSAVELAHSMNVDVCDCYSAWKELSKTEDTTMLLINRINHPVPEMHNLFADMLYDTIFSDCKNEKCASGSTMYKA